MNLNKSSKLTLFRSTKINRKLELVSTDSCKEQRTKAKINRNRDFKFTVIREILYRKMSIKWTKINQINQKSNRTTTSNRINRSLDKITKLNKQTDRRIKEKALIFKIKKIGFY